MIHLVTAANRGLYARQLGEFRRIEGRWVDPGSVWLLSLGPAEELLGHLRIRPTDDVPETWEASCLWADATAGDAHAGRHRLIAAACEVVLACGGNRMRIEVDVQDYPHLTDGILAFGIAGPPDAHTDRVMLDLACEVASDALIQMGDSLGETRPLTYLVEDEDLAIYGCLARVQQEVDLARQVDAAAATIDCAARADAQARIEAWFALCDALAGPGAD